MPNVEAFGQALDAELWEVHYQPIIDLATARIAGVEALVRWTLGGWPVPATTIVSLAEDSGLTMALTEFVMRSAMQQVGQWDANTGRRDVRLSINVSAVEIHEGGLIAMLDGLMAQTGFDPRRLDLELTERAARRNSPSAHATLQAMRSRAITLTLDDFDTGYSALSRLDRLPIDAVKIDKSFLRPVSSGGEGVIARAIIAMGRALGLRIVGEGVETETQLAFLKREGCDSAQGYLPGRPMPGADLGGLLETGGEMFSSR